MLLVKTISCIFLYHVFKTYLAKFWTHDRCSINSSTPTPTPPVQCSFFFILLWGSLTIKKKSYIKPDVKSIKLAHSLEGKNLNRWSCGGKKRAFEYIFFCTRCLISQVYGRENCRRHDVAENHYTALRKHILPWVKIQLLFMHMIICPQCWGN